MQRKDRNIDYDLADAGVIAGARPYNVSSAPEVFSRIQAKALTRFN